MTKMLVLESSLFPDGQSASRGVTAKFVERWRERQPDVEVTRRDLAQDPLPHLDVATFTGAGTPAAERSPEQAEAAALPDTLIAELMAADVLVIGAPMYNFGVPSSLKAWVDHIAIAGRTFRYTAQGQPEGLVHGKRVFVLASRGGIYTEGPAAAYNHQDTYLVAALGFLGMTDVTVVNAEGQKLPPPMQAGPRAREAADIDAAIAAI